MPSQRNLGWEGSLYLQFCDRVDCIAAFSYFSIATSTAERLSSPAAMDRSGIAVRCSAWLGLVL